MMYLCLCHKVKVMVSELLAQRSSVGLRQRSGSIAMIKQVAVLPSVKLSAPTA